MEQNECVMEQNELQMRKRNDGYKDLYQLLVQEVNKRIDGFNQNQKQLDEQK